MKISLLVSCHLVNQYKKGVFPVPNGQVISMLKDFCLAQFAEITTTRMGNAGRAVF